jgi:hypothetical protein
MARNKINDLRDHLFEMIERVKEAKPSEVESEIKKAKTISELSHQLIESAKIEVQYLDIAGQAISENEFLKSAPKQLTK